MTDHLFGAQSMHEAPYIWTKEDLESVATCPVCGNEDRTLSYGALNDVVYGVTSGTWQMFRCQRCRTGFLDPRPNRECIGKAYQAYFTHRGIGRDDFSRLSFVQKIERALANGYRNHRFGTNEHPAFQAGALIGFFLPKFRRRIQRSFRGLNRNDRSKRVLDVGCGGGNFLYWARAIGCEVYGADPDPVAVRNARENGFSVRNGGIEAFSASEIRFHVITIGNVIEHVHDPIDVLRQSFDLLTPGGRLWLETPNIDSHGHQLFGELWWGLDVPRHLVLFNAKSIETALCNIGFKDVSLQPGDTTAMRKKSIDLAKRHGRSTPEHPYRAADSTQADQADVFIVTAVKPE